MAVLLSLAGTWGASFHAGASRDRMSFSLRSLTYPESLAERCNSWPAKSVSPPSPEAIWQRERETLNAAIKEANTRPATLANRAFAAAVYGPHPYGFEMIGDLGAHRRVGYEVTACPPDRPVPGRR